MQEKFNSSCFIFVCISDAIQTPNPKEIIFPQIIRSNSAENLLIRFLIANFFWKRFEIV